MTITAGRKGIFINGEPFDFNNKQHVKLMDKYVKSKSKKPSKKVRVEYLKKKK